jgi:hypothetical protein
MGPISKTDNSPKEVLLARFRVDSEVVRMIYARLVGEDLYNHARAWPRYVVNLSLYYSGK